MSWFLCCVTEECCVPGVDRLYVAVAAVCFMITCRSFKMCMWNEGCCYFHVCASCVCICAVVDL